jgi:hypothetical protein
MANFSPRSRFSLFFIALALIILAGFWILGNKGENIPSETRTQTEELNLINEIISDTERFYQTPPPNARLEVWRSNRESIVLGTQGSDPNFPGLNDVRKAIERKEYKKAKELMKKGIFDRLKSPHVDKDGELLTTVALSKEQIKDYDPQFNFFPSDSELAIVSKSKFDIIVKYLKLFYKL